MVKLGSILFFAVGAFVALGVFIPRLRLPWKGTRIVAGALTCGGNGLVFMSLGIIGYFDESFSKQYLNSLYGLLLVGCLMVTGGFILDRRRAKRADMMKGFQTHLIRKKENLGA